LQISGKYMGITIVGLLSLVILIFGCVYNGYNSSNFTKINKTANDTYFADGVSFKCPDKWSVSTDNENGSDMIFASPEDLASIFSILSINPQFQVQIIPNTEFSNYNDVSYNLDDDSSNIMVGGAVYSEPTPGDVVVSNNYTGASTNSSPSDQEIVNIMQNSTDPSWNEISNNTLKIDNKTAYETTFIVNSLIPSMVDITVKQIVLVKNGKTYLMLLQAPNWSFDKEKPNFNAIINSFKVQ